LLTSKLLHRCSMLSRTFSSSQAFAAPTQNSLAKTQLIMIARARSNYDDRATFSTALPTWIKHVLYCDGTIRTERNERKRNDRACGSRGEYTAIWVWAQRGRGLNSGRIITDHRYIRCISNSIIKTTIIKTRD